ncbi:MAG: TrkH family potassium uptake protein, partial [Candidatus Methanoplasma sp.]|nr:TrkH family potassium uptake protein [Candidatus Methanoplasma sp.]
MRMFQKLRVRIKSMARWENSSIKLLGVIEIILGVALLVPVLIASIYGEDLTLFVYPIPVLLSMGIFQYIFFKSGKTMNPASGMMMIFTAWWVAFFVSAIPFYLYGFSFVDSLFEGVSGFTTTGASVIHHSALPRSMVFWSSFTQWAGGIAVVLIFLFLIPMMGIGGKAFVENELAGSGTYKFSMRIKNSAKNFISIYVLLSAVETILLMFSGIGPFESVTMMLSTISTGGFIGSGNIDDYSFAVQTIILVFMFMGGTNFYLHYRAFKKREFFAYRKSQEFIWTVILFLTAAAVLLGILLINTEDLLAFDAGDTVWTALFTAVSMGTTTGYTIA